MPLQPTPKSRGLRVQRVLSESTRTPKHDRPDQGEEDAQERGTALRMLSHDLLGAIATGIVAVSAASRTGRQRSVRTIECGRQRVRPCGADERVKNTVLPLPLRAEGKRGVLCLWVVIQLRAVAGGCRYTLYQ